VEVSRHELDRMGPSYTVDTARWAAKRYGDAIFLVGADEFCDFLSWRGPDEILDAVRLGVASRPGFPQERLDTVLRGLRRPERVEFFVIEPLPIESRDLRARVGRGESISGLVPPAVARLVEEGGLYRG
jgi:nicotinate-nucleotide adenylyltransferase